MTASPPAGSPGVVAWWWFAASAITLAVVPFAPRLAFLVPGCPLRRWTGIPCLTCGGTRAVVALAGGDLVRALALNPLVTVALVAFVACGLAAPLWLALGGKAPDLSSLSPRVRVAIALAIAASWVWVAIGPA